MYLSYCARRVKSRFRPSSRAVRTAQPSSSNVLRESSDHIFGAKMRLSPILTRTRLTVSSTTSASYSQRTMKLERAAPQFARPSSPKNNWQPGQAPHLRGGEASARTAAIATGLFVDIILAVVFFSLLSTFQKSNKKKSPDAPIDVAGTDSK